MSQSVVLVFVQMQPMQSAKSKLAKKIICAPQRQIHAKKLVPRDDLVTVCVVNFHKVLSSKQKASIGCDRNNICIWENNNPIKKINASKSSNLPKLQDEELVQRNVSVPRRVKWHPMHHGPFSQTVFRQTRPRPWKEGRNLQTTTAISFL